jgi:hypothetical protein
MKAAIDDWLQTLGYDGSVGVVHRAASDVRPDHPYAREIELMLRAPGAAAAAVFEATPLTLRTRWLVQSLAAGALLAISSSCLA